MITIFPMIMLFFMLIRFRQWRKDGLILVAPAFRTALWYVKTFFLVAALFNLVYFKFFAALNTFQNHRYSLMFPV